MKKLLISTITFSILISGCVTTQTSNNLEKARQLEKSAQYKEAFQIYGKEASNKNAEAAYKIAEMYLNGIGTKASPKASTYWYMKASEWGKKEAYAKYAEALYRGVGVQPDPFQALKVLEEGADEGDVVSMHKAGLMYLSGDACKQNQTTAMEFIRSAAKKDYSPAQYILGKIYEASGNPESTIWFKKAAELGMPEAQTHLANNYFSGKGVKRSTETAIKWYKTAANQGYGEATFALYKIYFNGRGVTKSTSEGLHWLKLGVKQGYAPSQNRLGVHYRDGIGVNKDPQQAISLFTKATKQNYTEAIFNFGKCYLDGVGTKQSTKNALIAFRRASDIGHTKATNAVAEIYENEGDIEKAVEFYIVGAMRNSLESQEKLIQIYSANKKFKLAYSWALIARAQKSKINPDIFKMRLNASDQKKAENAAEITYKKISN